MSAHPISEEPLLPAEVDGERLRKSLYFFFLNPADKWTLRNTFPGKLILKILMAVFVAAQLVVFSQERMPYFEYATTVDRVVHHKFLKDWSVENDPMAFPPGEKLYSLYQRSDLFEHISHLVISYYTLHEESLGSFDYFNSTGELFDSIPEMEVCVQVRRRHHKRCNTLNITDEDIAAIEEDPSKIEAILERNNITLFDGRRYFAKAEFIFNLESIRETDQEMNCHQVETSTLFDNTLRSGMIVIDLSVKLLPATCRQELLEGMQNLSRDDWFNILLDITVISCCLCSLYSSIRSLHYGLRLMRLTSSYFSHNRSQRMTFGEKLKFFQMWYIIVILNDIVVITGTCIKFSLSNTDFDNYVYTGTSLLLGLGIFVVSIDLLRYLTFLNVLISMTKFMTNVLQLIICAAIMYSAFLLAGWTIIGPYSPKFHTVERTSKTLFSLLNGDDMFTTFVTVESSNTAVLLFSTVYVYVFVSLFIYVLLSLVIAIFENAWYRTVEDRDRYRLPEQKTNLQRFIDELDLNAMNTQNLTALFDSANLL
ncbi:hypothetical protein QR680_006209 [Steinernema hermaphroditum]|uniref:Mucolipin extracytosolic domain-containing protein n=1 Tax=Steinernema hermaphroditum TaxID=289476 RepID=A0AA39HX36_9BILA|nr:hypothetical protein QR680_006209 [Steinernema hermaphroditum]